MMQQSIFLLLAVAAIDTLANPGNGYPYAAPHPDFAKRALMKRDVNSPDAAHQVHQAEYKAYINTPDGLDQASEAHQAQFAQLKAQAEAKAQQARHCDDVKNSGYICNDAFNELDYCFKGYPYYFGFGGSSGAGNGKVTVAKCCYFGTCGASDDGTVGLCYCQGTGNDS
ncbi:hypothetical protein HII31_13727 [Pseudocercospora fuligena]|uniref:Uncharacterized protein n=1 Tax=Pseudocercospora fuligena TaxID=685502 RepID=A0A8H6VBA7_9PEZI|nr:hypothetical protein HII31_13727 [Pseudocercospora fuligena]